MTNSTEKLLKTAEALLEKIAYVPNIEPERVAFISALKAHFGI
jgi:hypothetical protein